MGPDRRCGCPWRHASLATAGSALFDPDGTPPGHKGIGTDTRRLSAPDAGRALWSGRHRTDDAFGFLVGVVLRRLLFPRTKQLSKLGHPFRELS
jgi:hypothetical protein